MTVLTHDNRHFSRVTIKENEAKNLFAINCNVDLSDRLAALVANSIADSTRRAYRSDFAHFLAWGGSVPASPDAVAAYLAAHAEVLSPATLTRRLASVALAHRAKGLASPTSAEVVRAVLRGIRRTQGTSQASATPLLRDDLFIVLDCMGTGLKDVRDRALLLIGFAGGFRRSELVSLDHEDISTVRQGLILHLRRSKTDQEGAGRKIGIPHGRTRHCPVAALETWLGRSGITGGPLFRPINRHGHMADARLSGEAVATVIRERVSEVGIDSTGYSGHSLRSGFATSAAHTGASPWKIRQQTGHASDAMLSRYIKAGQMFEENAAAALL